MSMMDFLPPDLHTLRRSLCGRYLIEKEVGEDGVARYCVWVFQKVSFGFTSGAEAADEARSLEDHYRAAWDRAGGFPSAERVAAATPASAPSQSAPASE